MSFPNDGSHLSCNYIKQGGKLVVGSAGICIILQIQSRIYQGLHNLQIKNRNYKDLNHFTDSKPDLKGSASFYRLKAGSTSNCIINKFRPRYCTFLSRRQESLCMFNK